MLKVNKRKGVVLAELAILLPFLLLILLGILELGRAVMVRQELVNAAREGARRASPPGATTAVVVSTVNNYIASTSLHGTTPSVQVLNSSGTAVEVASLAPDAAIHVVVGIPYADADWGLSGFFIKGNLEAEVVVRKE